MDSFLTGVIITDPVIVTAASVIAAALLILLFIFRSHARNKPSINEPPVSSPQPADDPEPLPSVSPAPAAAAETIAPELDRTLNMPPAVPAAAPQPVFFQDEVARKLEEMAARIVSLEQALSEKQQAAPAANLFTSIPPELVTQKDIEPLVQRIEAKLELMASDRSSQVMEELQALSVRLEGIHKLLIVLAEK